MNKIVKIDEKACTGCGRCAKMCPKKILFIENGKCKVTDENKCDRLGGCMNVCAVNAIEIA